MKIPYPTSTVLKTALAAILLVSLAACETTKPIIIGPDAAFFDPERCRSWPTKAEGLDDAEYVLRGYQAFKCNYDSRIAAGEALKKLSQ